MSNKISQAAKTTIAQLSQRKALKRSKTVTKYLAPTPRHDPVVKLGKQLLMLWDADSGSQAEHFERKQAGRARALDENTDTQNFRKWRDAVENVISFTQATGPEGALVQLALSTDSVSNLDSLVWSKDYKQEDLEDKIRQIDRLMSSALRVLVESAKASLDPSIKLLIDIYGKKQPWMDFVGEWAAKGAADRASGE